MKWLVCTLFATSVAQSTINLYFADIFKSLSAVAVPGSDVCDSGFSTVTDSLIELFNTPDALSATSQLPALAQKYFSTDAVVVDTDCQSSSLASSVSIYAAQAPAGLYVNGTLADGLGAIGVNDTNANVRLLSSQCRTGARAGSLLVRWMSNQEDDVESYHFKYNQDHLITALWYLPNIAAKYAAALDLVLQ
eukprot:TRINITY_DN6427_c0_g1_i1.p1 TRINITY_DN6427_c0_g1~~TRINITY_DN6427_c0_g1_i1.p1  ORF type:complete len:192 (+),score=28.13 TRINITY_DN6427_c0_g1_i1:22-597(+)